MIPTMVFSMGLRWLDLFAGQDESEHECKETEGECDKEKVHHRLLFRG
jgi:hypothetical protein